MTESEWLVSEDLAAMLNMLRPTVHVFGSEQKTWISAREMRLFACACCRRAWHLLTDARSRQAVEVAERFADGLATEEERDSAWRAVSHWEHVSAVIEESIRPQFFVQEGVPPGVLQSVKATLLRDIVGNPWRSVPFGWQTVRAASDMSAAALDSGASEEQVWRGDWLITPTVLALAQAAYEIREGRVCEACGGTKARHCGDGLCACTRKMGHCECECEGCSASNDPCPNCHGAGRVEDGTLDADRLALLSDALEHDGGCPQEVACGCDHGLLPPAGEGQPWTVCPRCLLRTPGRIPNPLLAHLRSPGVHVRGCWALDLCLGKE